MELRGHDVGDPARWARLFGDLEAELAAALAVDDEAVADLTRAERASVTFADRLRGAVGTPVTVVLADGERLAGTVADGAETWVLLVGGGRQHLVPLAAVATCSGAGVRAVPGARRDVLGLGTVLRALSRDRARVLVRARGATVVGRVGRVGRDHLDVEADDGRGPQVVPFSALLAVTGEAR